jgi:UDP-N-acetylmuramate dehydrogenase
MTITTENLRGLLRPHVILAESNWFRVGGPADLLFKPQDAQDLATFMASRDANQPLTIIGVGSNLLVRDGGVRGVVVRLGRGFTAIRHEEGLVFAGAGGLGRNLAHWCAGEGIGGLAFLSGIPGTIGGAVAMNAGAYGGDVAQVLVAVEIVTAEGALQKLPASALNLRYRHADLPKGAIVTGAWFVATPEDPAKVQAQIDQIQASREATQPIRERTGGSTFKNPQGHKAWEVIDAAGCRGLTIGRAQMSEKHCNFMINTGDATAAELEALGEEVIRRVREHSGITLEWEIQRIGEGS